MASEKTLDHSPAVETFQAHYAALRRRRRQVTAMGLGLFGLWFAAAAWIGEFNLGRVSAGLPRIFEYVEKILPELRPDHLREDMAYWFYGLPDWLALLGETVLMAYTATLLGTLGAAALCFFAAQNLTPGGPVYFITRRLLELARTIPDLVYALIFVFAFGLGPLAGILAIAMHSMGGSGKLFAEAVENIDMKPVDGLRAAGANWVQTIRYGFIPQVLPMFLSSALYIFESNVRTATILGIVGAGGIGFHLADRIRAHRWEEACLILITVAAIDLLSKQIRQRLIGGS